MERSKNLLVSFSGGETSAFMAKWIKKHLEDQYESVIYVFANTGLENEQTLDFVQMCDDKWSLNVYWVEASVRQRERKGTGYWLTNFWGAKRKGEPFESVIQKYGIPNAAWPQCTRELKVAPIHKFAKDYFQGQKYDTAIGIRIDEIDRVDPMYKQKRFIYPLVFENMLPSSKQKVNWFWKNQDFRLQLKGYQGNCLTCWKKSDEKLFQIYKENPNAFDFMKRMEQTYGIDKNGNKVTFFRGHRSAEDMIELAHSFNGKVLNDAESYNYQLRLLEETSCDIHSQC